MQSIVVRCQRLWNEQTTKYFRDEKCISGQKINFYLCVYVASIDKDLAKESEKEKRKEKLIRSGRCLSVLFRFSFLFIRTMHCNGMCCALNLTSDWLVCANDKMHASACARSLALEKEFFVDLTKCENDLKICWYFQRTHTFHRTNEKIKTEHETIESFKLKYFTNGKEKKGETKNTNKNCFYSTNCCCSYLSIQKTSQHRISDERKVGKILSDKAFELSIL